MNGQQIPTGYMMDPAPLPRMRLTARNSPAAAGTHGTVPLDESIDTFANDAGRDFDDVGVTYGAGQRQEARLTESRNALTTGGVGPDALTAPPGTGPTSTDIVRGPMGYPPVRRRRFGR